MCGLPKDRILMTASAFNLMWHVSLVEVFEENSFSHRYVVKIERTS